MGRLGAELAREREAPCAAADDEDPGPAAARHLEGQEPERSRPDDRDGFTGPHATTADGADDDREGLGERQVLVGGRGRRLPAAARRDAHELGEAAVHVDSDRRARQTEVAVALPAERTRPARVVRLDRDAIAGRHARHARTDRLDATDELVPHHPGVGHGPVARPDAVVGAAETGHGDAHQDLVGLDLGRPRRLDPQVARTVKNGGFHAGNVPHSPAFS